MFLSRPSFVRQLFVHYEQIIPPPSSSNAGRRNSLRDHFRLPICPEDHWIQIGRTARVRIQLAHTHDSRARVHHLLVVNGAAVALLLAPTLALEAKKSENPLDPGSSINDVYFYVKPLVDVF